jgi:hypothetical protein
MSKSATFLTPTLVKSFSGAINSPITVIPNAPFFHIINPSILGILAGLLILFILTLQTILIVNALSQLAKPQYCCHCRNRSGTIGDDFSTSPSGRINLMISVRCFGQSQRRLRKQSYFPTHQPQSHPESTDLPPQNNYNTVSEPPQKGIPIPTSALPALPTLPTSTLVSQSPSAEPPSYHPSVTPYITSTKAIPILLTPPTSATPALALLSEVSSVPIVKPTPPSSIVTLQADPSLQVALDKVLPVELLQQIDLNKRPGLLAVRDNGVTEYILYGTNGKVVCILLLQPDGTFCFKRMSSQVKQSPLLDSSDFRKTIPPQLAALGVTLDSQLLLLSVKDGVGVYGIYNTIGNS